MLVIYAIPLALLVGRLQGGRVERLAELDFHGAWLAVGGFAAQLLLFSTPLGRLVGDAAPALYVLSTGAVLLAVLGNLHLRGLRLVAVGAASNLVAILANGGYMPADPEALAFAGLSPTADGVSNSIVSANPAFPALTDILAAPDWLPFANVFSIGDALIAIGIFVAITAGMTRPAVPIPVAATAAAPVREGTSPD